MPSAGSASSAFDVSRLSAMGALFGSIVALCVGTSFAKNLFESVGAPGVTALRVGISALLLCAVWRPWRARWTRADLTALALFGAVLGSMNLMFYMAISRVPLGVAIAIQFSGPLALALASSRRWLDVLWVALAVGGVGLLLPLGQTSASLDPVGVAFALGAGALWALYIVLGGRLGHLHGGRSIALAMVAAAMIALPFGLASAGTALFDPNILAVALGVAILSSAIPYSLEIFALPRLPRQTFGVLLSLEPAVGSLAGLVILGERLSLTEWIAIGAIVTASVGAAIGAGRSGVAHPHPEAQAGGSNPG